MTNPHSGLRSGLRSGSRWLSLDSRWWRVWGLCLALLATVALATPSHAAPAAAASGPMSGKVVLGETSIDAPALWSLANGTVSGGFNVSGTPTAVSALAWAGTDTF